ncbi:Pycsar system effector family protein [Streptomyces sp. NBRC 109706]|uniref:Pycsar system effector family protein n=1 Tax=Streptomyces sp. NBRC 109706 TaxID=1550035 RepID=UPI000781D454|nr:Pycsar system effector family protein [Streptomyces sp. NBRC 109706]
MAEAKPEFPRRLAEQLLAEVRVEIARADSKAALLVAALGLGAGLFGGMTTSGDWSPGALPPAGRLSWWLGVVALMVALAAFLLAVAPRFGSGEWTPEAPLTYFGDIHQAAVRGRLREALSATEAAPDRRLVQALEFNSRIASVKLRWVRHGLVAVAAGVVLISGALLSG